MISLVALAVFAQVMCSPDGGAANASYVKTIAVCSAVGTVGYVGAGSSSSTSPASPNLSVQFNNAGAFGGANEVMIDGGHLALVGQTTTPAAPTGNVWQPYVFKFTTTQPSIPEGIDSYWGRPMPTGLIGAYFNKLGTTYGWEVTCTITDGFNNTGTTTIGQAGGGTITAGAAAAKAWSSADLYGRTRFETSSLTLTAGQKVTRLLNALQCWRGNTAGAGGFMFFTRINMDTVNTGGGRTSQQSFFGLINRTTILTAAAEPSSFADSVYVGNDSFQTTLRICSNDNAGSATCSDLGSNFPVQTGAFYDVWLSAAPNSSTIEYAVQRLDSVFTATGSLSADLPRNTVQLTWQDTMGTGSDGGALVFGFSQSCLAWGL